MLITPEADRKKTLIERGVSVKFLDAIDNSEKDDTLRYLLRYPSSAYSYLPDIASKYSILEGYDITPIYDGSNGDTFWVLLTNGAESKFVKFELEQDEIYDDYGNNFMLLLANFVIDLYENSDELDDSELSDKAKEIGFDKGHDLITALREADEMGERRSFEADSSWRKENLPRFI